MTCMRARRHAGRTEFIFITDASQRPRLRVAFHKHYVDARFAFTDLFHHLLYFHIIRALTAELTAMMARFVVMASFMIFEIGALDMPIFD